MFVYYILKCSNLMKSYDLLISSTSTTGINQVVDVDNYREILLCATHSSNGTIYNAAMIPIGWFTSTSAGSMFRCSGGSFFAQCYTANGSITASVSVDGYCAKIYGIKWLFLIRHTLHGQFKLLVSAVYI